MDLKPFCYEGDLRPYIEKPWSIGEYTYATNGHILIRVPRRDDAPDISEVPNAIKDPEIVLRKVAHQDTYKPIPAFTLPPLTTVECDECNGEGHPEHCCTCECTCDYCDGSGRVSSDARTSAEYRGVHFALKYLRMICALPNVEVSDPTAAEPMGFRFDGGVGGVMALRQAYEKQVAVFDGGQTQEQTQAVSDPAHDRDGKEST